MNREEQFVITISRQFGTGGHEIGAEIARRLGVKLLDKQILNEVAKRIPVVEDAMERIAARNPLWRDDFTNFYRTYMNKAEYDGQEHDETSHALFEAQAIAIRKIAEDCRKRRIAEKYGLGLSDAAAMVVDNDYSRELYTKTFTGKDWTDARNYDISIDVRKFGINGAVDFLMKCIE